LVVAGYLGSLGLAAMPRRWFALFVGLWGVIWLAYAWFAREAFNALTTLGKLDALALVSDPVAARTSLTFALVLFSISAFVALGSAVGFFTCYRVAKRVWLFWCIVLALAYVTLLLTEWSWGFEHFEFIVLGPLSWAILRANERIKSAEP